MEQVQVQKLKINASNIKNTLVSYNKQLIKLRKDESRITFTDQKRRQAQAKEEKVEKGSISTTIESIKSRIISGPMGFFDKVKEFFGIVLLGLLLNNLPRIIQSLKKFFSDNKWIIDVVKFSLKVIGDGIMGIIWLVDKYPKAVMQNIDKEREKLKQEIDQLIGIADGVYGVWSSIFGSGKPQQKPSPQQSSQGNQGSMPPPPSPTAVGSLKYQGSPINPTQQSATAPGSSPIQAFAKGGTVKGGTTSRIGSSFRGATPTPLGRKAIESTDSFETFATVASDAKMNSIILGGKNGVNDNFTGVNNSLEQFLKFMSGEGAKPSVKPSIPPGAIRPGPGGITTPGGVKVDPGDVLGTVGSTGESTGPHLHIETGDGYGGAGGTIPKNVLDNVFIGGVPLSKLSQGDGLGAGRNHKGFDFPANPGTSVTIGGNLKFLEYDEGYNAGYGNSLIIVDENGNTYLLGHLNSGPTAEALKKIKDKKKQSQVKPLQVSRNIGEVPDETLMAMNSVDFFVTQVIEKPVPMPVPFRVNSSSSYDTSVPEINPLLLV